VVSVAGEKILFVDDDEHIRKLVSTFLERRGYQVRLATNGLEGLSKFQEDPADLVILDMNMPFMNGIELTRRLRENQESASLPIIMLSAQKSAESVLEGYREGADEYVAKPVEMSVLAAKVERLLERSRPAMPEADLGTGHVVVFAHAKGGVGTTTLAVNTSLALIQSRPSRVALLDLDLEFGNTAIMLDVQPKKTMAELGGVNAEELDDHDFNQLVATHSSGIRLIAPGLPEEAELAPLSMVQQVVRRLQKTADYVLIDTASNFSERTLGAIDMADIVCLVTSQQLASLTTTKDHMNVLEKLGVPPERIRLMLNRTSPGGPANEQIESFFGRRPDAIIPYAPMFDDAANTGHPLVQTHPDVPGSIEVRGFASKLAAQAPVADAAGQRVGLRATA
jgi:pilus assembly protein CpaE